MDDGDELIVLRVVTLDMSGKKTAYNDHKILDNQPSLILSLSFFYITPDKKSVIQAQLEHESKQARQNATKVMERIMESSGPDSKVSCREKGWITGKIMHIIVTHIFDHLD